MRWSWWERNRRLSRHERLETRHLLISRFASPDRVPRPPNDATSSGADAPCDAQLTSRSSSTDAPVTLPRRRHVVAVSEDTVLKSKMFLFRLGPATVLTQAWKDSAWAEPSKLSLSIPNAANETAYSLGMSKFWFYCSDYWSREIWLTNL